jgi:hypothetical protein
VTELMPTDPTPEREARRFPQAKDIPEGFWAWDTHDHTAVYQATGGWLRAAGGGGMGGNIAHLNLRPATKTEVSAFVAESSRIEAEREARRQQEAAILARYGLAHDDFVRFRSCREADGVLYVETRENGVSERSVQAIKKGNVISAHADDGDPTYECYEFAPVVSTGEQP